MVYSVEEIESNAEDLEQLGSKEKFWFYLKERGDIKWLFKFSRENTGEHWSEKAAEQLCELIYIPHVIYRLARCNGRLGVISPNIVPEACRMVMGNEVLHTHSPHRYPMPELDTKEFVRVKKHTISRVLGCLDKSGVLPPKTNIDSNIDLNGLNAGDVFCGYLMLDALISNQDRHHENWAIIIDGNTDKRYLCPTYDHAASLGRELLDSERMDRLSTRDKNRTVDKFVLKARSGLFRLKTDTKPLLTVDAFYASVKKRDVAKRHWLNKLRNLADESISAVFYNIPDDLISEHAREFAIQMVLQNKNRLLGDERA